VLIDTHCHLGDPQFELDRDTVIARAREAGVGHVVIVADSADATEHAISLALAFEYSATGGVHPHEASSWNVDVAERVAAALNDAAVVAVGEAGLDYHYDHSPRPTQRRVFAEQLALAAEHRKPIVIHARDADEDMAAMVGEWCDAVPAMVLHSFSSGPAVFEAGLHANAYFGFSGMVTFKNWKMSDVVRACPVDRLLLETDAPYLAPVPHRGKRNEPAFVPHIAARVAELRGVAADQLARQTTLNAERCFGARVTRNHH
jgi:TatD DNase family protein